MKNKIYYYFKKKSNLKVLYLLISILVFSIKPHYMKDLLHV